MSSKRHITRNKKFPARYMPANCAEIVVAEIGFCGTWDLQKRKRSIENTALVFVYEIQL